jgi:hypothetical protein
MKQLPILKSSTYPKPGRGPVILSTKYRASERFRPVIFVANRRLVQRDIARAIVTTLLFNFRIDRKPGRSLANQRATGKYNSLFRSHVMPLAVPVPFRESSRWLWKQLQTTASGISSESAGNSSLIKSLFFDLHSRSGRRSKQRRVQP